MGTIAYSKTDNITKFWNCQCCLNLFTARELFPCVLLDEKLRPKRYLLCADCLAESENMEMVKYVDEVES